MMDKEEHTKKRRDFEKKEIIKVIFLSILWVALLGLSFLTYFAIPGIIFISWIMIAWFIKAFKEDMDDGSGYDSES